MIVWGFGVVNLVGVDVVEVVLVYDYVDIMVIVVVYVVCDLLCLWW